MEVSMTRIALSALLSVLLGFSLGPFYDAIRFLRVLFGITVASPFGKKGVRPYLSWLFAALGDLLFMLVAAVCMSVFFFLTGDGRMRGYSLVGAFLGFEVYYHTVGRLFIGTVDFLAKKVRALYRFVAEKVYALAVKIGGAFLRAPIVCRARSWYNDYTKKRKAAAIKKKRQRKMARSGIRNGF